MNMSGESNDEKSWNEIKIAREIWPPDIEEILFHYKKAEIIDPKYYQIYKDRARLYYVLGEIEKSKQEYLKWCNLDSKWIEEVDKEVNSREKYRNKNIHPWVRLQKFLEYGEEKVVEKVNTNFELEKIRKKQRNKEKYERKKQSEIRRREEEKISSQKFIGNLNKKNIESIIDEKNNFSFNTRRNRKLNLTEFYDLVYEYKNDCLTAALKFNKTFYEDKVVYVGDAAHSIHPIAGQGWNLGLRDIKSLTNILKKNKDAKNEIGTRKFCKAYNDLCFYDAYRLFEITDKLDWIFKKDQEPLKFVKKLGFNIINKNKTLKNQIVNFAMGI